jgi:hypothetical protein
VEQGLGHLNEARVFVAQIASGLFQGFLRQVIARKQSIRAQTRAFTIFPLLVVVLDDDGGLSTAPMDW